jgi:hypothetical protein
VFRCRHCEYLQTQLERARSDSRQDLADQRTTLEKEISRLTELLNEALRRNDVLQLAVLQGVGSAAGSAYVNRVDRAAGVGDDFVELDEALPQTAEEMAVAPFAKIKRAAMLADKTSLTETVKWMHERKEKDNQAALASPPGAFVVNPRPENDLVESK